MARTYGEDRPDGVQHRQVLVVDFHGCLSSYGSGKWMQKEAATEDAPTPGAIEWLDAASRKFRVVIWSGRFIEHPGSCRAVRDWLIHHGFPADRITLATLPENDPRPFVLISPTRPRSFLSLDDRAIQFDGTWPDVDGLLAFKPWHKRR